jgi:hypothetical protein
MAKERVTRRIKRGWLKGVFPTEGKGRRRRRKKRVCEKRTEKGYKTEGLGRGAKNKADKKIKKRVLVLDKGEKGAGGKRVVPP